MSIIKKAAGKLSKHLVKKLIHKDYSDDKTSKNNSQRIPFSGNKPDTFKAFENHRKKHR